MPEALEHCRRLDLLAARKRDLVEASWYRGGNAIVDDRDCAARGRELVQTLARPGRGPHVQPDRVGGDASRHARIHDRIGRGRVGDPARTVQVAKAIVLDGERPLALIGTHALPRGRERHIEPHRSRLRGKRLPCSLAREHAATRSDHGPVAPLEQLADHVLLEHAERRFAVLGEDPRDRLSRGTLELGVGIEERPLEIAREQGADRRLAGSHEADEDER